MMGRLYANPTYRAGINIDMVASSDQPCSDEDMAKVNERLAFLGRPTCKRHLTQAEYRAISGALSRAGWKS